MSKRSQSFPKVDHTEHSKRWHWRFFSPQNLVNFPMQSVNEFDQEVSTVWDIHASLARTLGQDQTASFFIYMLQLILFAEDSSGIYKCLTWSLLLALGNVALSVSNVRVGAGALVWVSPEQHQTAPGAHRFPILNTGGVLTTLLGGFSVKIVVS